MVVLRVFVVFLFAIDPTFPEEIPLKYLNVGALLSDKDDTANAVLELAAENANIILKEYNYAIQIKTEVLEDNHSFNAIKKVCNLLQMGIVALIDPISEIPSLHLSSLCSKYHIPHLITNCQFPESSNIYPMDIRISPSCDQYANIIYHYISEVEKWNDMIVIYSSDNSILKFEYLLNQFEFHFTMRQWIHNDIKKKKQLLKEISQSQKYRHFLVDIPYWQINDFLIMASVHNISGPQNSFILSDWDASLLDLALFKINNKVNITTFSIMNQTLIDVLKKTKGFASLLNKIINKEKPSPKTDIKGKFMTRPAILYDSVNLLAQSIIQFINTNQLLPSSIVCSSNVTWNLGPNLFNALISMENVHGITGQHLFNEKFLREEYNLSVMELSENGFVNNGYWDSNKFVIHQKQLDLNDTQIVIYQSPLRVTTIISPPFVHYKDGEPDELNYESDMEAWTGFCIDLLALISEDLDLNFTIHLVKDGLFGLNLPNETNPDGTEKWNGMIGELISKEADLAVAPMTISYEREKVVDFTTPFMSLGLSILFLRPQKEAPGLFSFLSPVSPPVWVYVISAYIGVSVIIFLTAHITPYEWFQNPPGINLCSKHNQFNILNSLWFAVGALVRQGLEFCPQASSTRMISGAWWFFTLIIISTYTANLAAFLTVEQFILPIKSVEDLVNQTQIKYGTLKGGASEAFFEKSLIITYQRMYEFMKTNPGVLVNSTLEGIDKVRNSKGKYAFLLESAMNDYYTQKDCSLMRVGDMLDSKGYGIGFPAGSPLRDKMTKSILKLQKSQRLANLIHKWWKEVNITEPCDSKEKGSAPASLNVNQVGGVFFLLGAGFLMAACVSVIEVYVDYCQKQINTMVSFGTYLRDELIFAMRFMSSSKKSVIRGIHSKKSAQKFMVLDNQTILLQSSSTTASHNSDGILKLMRINQNKHSLPHISTDFDIPRIYPFEDSFGSHDTL